MLVVFLFPDGLKAQTHLFTLNADSLAQTTFGDRVASAGDVNADGCDDVITRSDWDTSKSLTGVGARVYSGRDGRLLLAITNLKIGAMDAVGIGDLNRDGHADVALTTVNVQAKRYELWFVSGKTGKRLRTVSLAGFRQPDTLAPAGDVNRDGYPDLLIGDPTYGFFRDGRAAVVSGKDGSLIYDFKPGGPYTAFGWSVAGPGDVNRDGYADFMIGDWAWGRAWLYSGKTGKVLFTFSEPLIAGNGFGSDVAGLGDIDRDGYPDLAVGANGYSPKVSSSGAVFIYSGKTGKRIRAIYGQQKDGALGGRLQSVGDWNSDGIPDLAVTGNGGPKAPLYAGHVFIYSGKDAKILAIFAGKKKFQGLGGSLAAGDLDGDGRTDLLIGMSPANWIKPPLWKEIVAWSPVKKTLWTDTHQVSLAKQGQQMLHLDAGPKHAGSGYFLLGSLSGIKPGLKLGGGTLPLQPDAWFWLTASYPNSSLLKNSLGILDSKGRATATFRAIPGLPPNLAGARADHAYLLFSKGRFTLTSNWAPLLFEK